MRQQFKCQSDQWLQRSPMARRTMRECKYILSSDMSNLHKRLRSQSAMVDITRRHCERSTKRIKKERWSQRAVFVAETRNWKNPQRCCSMLPFQFFKHSQQPCDVYYNYVGTSTTQRMAIGRTLVRAVFQPPFLVVPLVPLPVLRAFRSISKPHP